MILKTEAMLLDFLMVERISNAGKEVTTAHRMCTSKVGVFQQIMTINYVKTQSFVCEYLEKGRH